METREEHARAALERVAEGRRLIADGIETPSWYHPILGLVVAVVFAGPAFGRPWAFAICDAVGALGIVLLVRAYRDRVGVWSAGRLHGAAARVRYVYLAALFVVYVPCVAVASGPGPRWIVAVGCAWAFAATAVLGPRYDARLRAELRGEA